MKLLILSALFAIVIVSTVVQAQEKVGLYFETAPYCRSLDIHRRVCNALRIGWRPNELTLVQAVCVPSFEPAWVVRIYHPMATGKEVILGDTMTTFWPDSLQSIVESVTSEVPLAVLSSKPDHWSGWSRGSTRCARSIPLFVADSVENAFLEALRLARWGSEYDLLQVDGADLHYAAYDRRLQTNIAVRGIDDADTVASVLHDLSRRLYMYSKTQSDSSAVQLEREIVRLSSEIRSLCATIVHSSVGR